MCGVALPRRMFAPTTTLHISWSSSAGDLAHFLFDDGTGAQQTSATSTTLAVTDNSTRTISVSAVDTTGNTSAISSQRITVMSAPVVINEVAWSGTQASFADEWIELYNRANVSVDLAGFTLYATELLAVHTALRQYSTAWILSH